MKITDSSARDHRVEIELDESERFNITFRTTYMSREDGATLRVYRLVAGIDLAEGTASVKAYGFLLKKDGTVGDRDRSQYLEVDDIQFEVRDIVAEEARQARERIAAIQGVTFE